ncbi:MAG: Methylamine utilization protein mauG, partial [Myxococcaceae bacterium]|nr:Methylamine utilization protein mauG [Myxococcaceae bacterium]
PAAPFHNIGLYNLGASSLYPRDNRGLYEFTRRAADMGRFRTPSLRNVTLTAPYMHDGSMATLDEVLDHYAAGGRTIEHGALSGVGADSVYKDRRIGGFTLSASERSELLAFLASLTDQAFARP